MSDDGWRFVPPASPFLTADSDPPTPVTLSAPTYKPCLVVTSIAIHILPVSSTAPRPSLGLMSLVESCDSSDTSCPSSRLILFPLILPSRPTQSTQHHSHSQTARLGSCAFVGPFFNPASRVRVRVRATNYSVWTSELELCELAPEVALHS